MQGKCWLVLLLAAAGGFGLTSVIHVAPIKAAWSGWTEPELYNYVSEVITLNVDSLGPPGYCELFVGDLGQTPNAPFNVGVYTYPDGVTELAGKQGAVAVQGHTWLRCTLTVAHPESLLKGQRYEFRWSRTSGARIQYYYNYCATRYDSMAAAAELDSRTVRPRIG